MKKYYYLIFALTLSIGAVRAQNVREDVVQETTGFDESFNPIRTELEEWDAIRGPWLATSLEAMSKKEPIPDRTFPEDITPAQMVDALPERTRSSIERIAMNNSNTGNTASQQQWTEIRRVLVRPNAGCTVITARSYGDPHIVTYDGARYSFQTVGEFVLTKSTSGMEVQTRQRPQREDFSLNTAVAMNVGGDRVGIYASDFPDGNRTPVRVNGLPVVIPGNKAYFLPNGGTIRHSGSTYTVAWPSGETVTARMRSTGGMRFMNVHVRITECSSGIFTGLMGNANGMQGDDFQGMNDRPDLAMSGNMGIFGSVSREMEQRRLAFLANSLADEHRVTQLTSLFDYGIGESTMTFTDRSFPRVHRTLNEIPPGRRNSARRRCQQQGISDRDLNGCIFDQAHLGLPPEPEPIVNNPAQGMIFEDIREERPNVNVAERPNIKEESEIAAPVYTPMPMPTTTTSRPINTRTEPTSRPNTSTTTTTRPTTTTKETEPTRTESTSRPSNSGFGIFGGSNSGSSRPVSSPAPRPVSTPRPSTPVRTTPSRPSTPTPAKTIPSTRGISRGGR